MSMPFTLHRRHFLKSTAAALALMAAGVDPVAAATLAQKERRFIENLLRRMTIEEKAGQLSLFTAPFSVQVNPVTGPPARVREVQAQVRAGGAIGYFGSFDPVFLRSLQKIAVEESRLGIPLIFAIDVIHGLRTIYPTPLGEAASFDPDLCYRTARASAQEGSGFGLHWYFGPMVDVARDQRWGRVTEGAGEDPWLGSLLAAARVRGYQGPDLKADDGMLACPKHFAAYGAVEAGMDYNSVDMSQVTLHQVHLPPFKAAFDAGALSVMSSFNDIGGVPSTGNRALLTGILRDQWKFSGLVVSDYESEKELIAHGFAEDEEDAVIKALTAGCDVSMQSGLYNKHIPALVRSGRLPVSIVDEAVRRVLRVKQALGLFDNPYRSLAPERRAQVEGTSAMIALAREAARKSIVLLKNEGDILPLPKSGKSFAFIGPYVSDKFNAFGAWAVAGDLGKVVTLEDSVRAMLAPDARISFTKGCAPTQPIDGGIEAAVAAAKAADVAILFVGETTSRSGEAASTVSITLSDSHQALVEAVAATGKPMVVLLKHGRGLALAGACLEADAIVATWFLGSQTGHGITDVLFGDHAPQGRLPVSFPQAAGQQPFYYNHRSTGRPQISPSDKAYKARYLEVTNESLFPFGYGLGYAQISYSATELDKVTIGKGQSVKVSATLKNEGKRAHHEVVQLYIHDRVASITQPVRVLRNIQHVDIDPGQSRVVEFELRPDDLSYIHADLGNAADPGKFDIWIAPDATRGTAATLTLI